METPDPLRESFRMQKVLNERIGVKTGNLGAAGVFNACVKPHEVNFERQESGYTRKDEQDSKHI